MNAISVCQMSFYLMTVCQKYEFNTHFLGFALKVDNDIMNGYWP